MSKALTVQERINLAGDLRVTAALSEGWRYPNTGCQPCGVCGDNVLLDGSGIWRTIGPGTWECRHVMCFTPKGATISAMATQADVARSVMSQRMMTDRIEDPTLAKLVRLCRGEL